MMHNCTHKKLVALSMVELHLAESKVKGDIFRKKAPNPYYTVLLHYMIYNVGKYKKGLIDVNHS